MKKKYNLFTITKKEHFIRDPDYELYTFKTLHIFYILLTYIRMSNLISWFCNLNAFAVFTTATLLFVGFKEQRLLTDKKTQGVYTSKSDHYELCTYDIYLSTVHVVVLYYAPIYSTT